VALTACGCASTSAELLPGRAVGQLPEPYWLDYMIETDASLETTLVTATIEVDGSSTRLDLRRVANQWSVARVWQPIRRPRRTCAVSERRRSVGVGKDRVDQCVASHGGSPAS